MLHRVDKDVKPSVKISTIHSFCLQVINFHKPALGKKSIRIIDDGTARKILKECIVKLNPQFQGVHLSKDLTSRLSSEVYNAQKVISKRKSLMIRAKDSGDEVYQMYQAALNEIDGVDFSDFMLYAADILSQNSDILAKYTNTFKYLLVDEFQDLSVSQYEILRLFYTKNQRISIVGDEDQSIYAFRGGNPALFNNFRTLTKGKSLEVQLAMNYRSSSHIIDGFMSVIKPNKDRKDKVIKHTRGYGEKIKLYPFTSTEEEIKYICGQIEALKDKVPWGEIAILCRLRKNVIPPFLEELKKRKIPCTREKAANAGLVMCYLSIVGNIYSEDDFYNVINTPKRGLGTIKTYINAFAQKYQMETRPLLLIIKEIIKEEGPDIGNAKCTEAALKGICKFDALIETLKKHLSKVPLDEFITFVWDKTRLATVEPSKPQTDESYDEDDEENPIEAHYKSVQEVCSRFLKTEDFETSSQQLSQGTIGLATLEFFINYWKLSDEGESSGKANQSAVFVSSIHQSKGLEFKHVFVLRLNDGVCPMTMSDVDPQEERRLFYVAMSRAKDHLTITYQLGARGPKSRFLSDIKDNSLEFIQPEKPGVKYQEPSWMKYSKKPYYGKVEEAYKGPPLPKHVPKKAPPSKSVHGLFAEDAPPVVKPDVKPVIVPAIKEVFELPDSPKKTRGKRTPKVKEPATKREKSQRKKGGKPKAEQGSEVFDLDDVTEVIITPQRVVVKPDPLLSTETLSDTTYGDRLVQKYAPTRHKRDLEDRKEPTIKKEKKKK
jgi:DNA helicase-2/ATP-dependent DNA helicase PcrA